MAIVFLNVRMNPQQLRIERSLLCRRRAFYSWPAGMLAGRRCSLKNRGGAGHHQGGRAAFAFQHDVHQRDNAERHDPMMIDEQNKKGGSAGARSYRPSSSSPASDWPLFAEKAAQFTGERQSLRGVWMLDLRFPKVKGAGFREKTTDLLFYPVQYEGEESSKNVIYTGAAPNFQQAIPAVDLPDEGSRREAVGARRNGLRLPAHHQQNSGGVSAGERA